MNRPAPVGESLACSCGADCPTHGIITLEDRLAAFEAGRQQGVIEGRMQAISEDVAALNDAAHLIGYVTERAVIAARDGQDSAALFVERTDTKAVDR